MRAKREQCQFAQYLTGPCSCAVQEHQAKGGKVTVPVGCVGLEDWLLDNVDIYKLLPRLRQGAGSSSLLAAAGSAELCCAALQSCTQAEAGCTCFPSHVAAMCATAVLQAAPTMNCSCGVLQCTDAKPACGFASDRSLWSPLWPALCHQAASSHMHTLCAMHTQEPLPHGSGRLICP